MTVTVNGNLDINGTSGSGVTWTNVDLTLGGGGTYDADWTVVSGSTVTGGTIDATDNCTDSGGNTGWNFGAAGVTGDLAAQETGADVLAFVGDLLINGDIAAQETGADSLAITGSIVNRIYWAVYPSAQGDPTAAQIQGETVANGIFSNDIAPVSTALNFEGATITGLTASTSYKLAAVWYDNTDYSNVIITGAFSTTGGVSGDLAAQESGSDTATLSGSVAVAGDLAAQETGSDTAALTGDVLVTGNLSVQEIGSDTLAIVGEGAEAPITGDLAAQEVGSDTATVTGSVRVSGDVSLQEIGGDVAALTGTIIVVGNLSAQESGSDTLEFRESELSSGSLVAVETGSDTLSIGGFSAGNGLEIPDEIAMTAQLYNGLGQTVIYENNSGVAQIKMIVDVAEELFPSGFEASAADGDVKARVQKTDVSAPIRGDTISNRYGVRFTVEHYRTLNQAEWEMELRQE